MNKPFHSNSSFIRFLNGTLPVMLAICLLMPARLGAQGTVAASLSCSFVGTPLPTALEKIREMYSLDFYYKDEWFRNDTLTLSLDNVSAETMILRILEGRPYTYRIVNGSKIVILPKDLVAAASGQLTDYTGNGGSAKSSVVIGDPDRIGQQRTADVTGKVTDGKTGEPIIGATIQIENMLQGAVSGIDGAYRLTVNPGLYTLIYSCIGYESATYSVKVISDGAFNVELFDKSIAIEDVIIYGQRVDRNVTGHQMSLLELDNRMIKQLPVISGGKDVLKGLVMMPGVKSVGEFSSGINVRGGGEDQNLYIINQAPIFNTSHVFGLFSVVSPDMVDRLTLYKGHIPAIYGERVSSVIDIRTREAAPEKARLKGGIGLYDSKLMLELPLVGDKIFLALGGRTSYSNWLLSRMQDYDLKNSKAMFYDLNGTLNLNFGRNRLLLTLYTSYDDFEFADEIRYAYGSKVGSFNWTYTVNPDLASYFTLAYSTYGVEKDDIYDEINRNRITSGITYQALRYRMKYSGLNHHLLDAGFSLIRYGIQPGKQNPLGLRSLIQSSVVEPEQGMEGAFFINDEYTVSSYLTFNLGLRLSGMAYLGPGTVLSYDPSLPRDTSSVTDRTVYAANDVIKSYFGLEPRLSAKVQLNSASSVKLSYDRNLQYLSLISNSSVSTPGDIWKLADPYIKPLIANQVAVGFYRNFSNNTIESSVELYYKHLTNVIEYKVGAEIDMAQHIETILLNATGRNYGVEFLLKKNTGKVDGWVSYTYSKSLRRTSGKFVDDIINNNRYFPSSYDRPHDFTVVANYHVNKRLSLSANFSYATGRPITLPEYKYFTGSETVVFFSDKNKYRIPDYHRLDFTISYDESLRIRKKWKGSWSISLLNVYGRDNPYTIYYKKEEPAPTNDFRRFSLYKLYLIGRPVPTITYNFIF